MSVQNYLYRLFFLKKVWGDFDASSDFKSICTRAQNIFFYFYKGAEFFLTGCHKGA